MDDAITIAAGIVLAVIFLAILPWLVAVVIVALVGWWIYANISGILGMAGMFGLAIGILLLWDRLPEKTRQRFARQHDIFGRKLKP